MPPLSLQQLEHLHQKQLLYPRGSDYEIAFHSPAFTGRITSFGGLGGIRDHLWGLANCILHSQSVGHWAFPVVELRCAFFLHHTITLPSLGWGYGDSHAFADASSF